MTTVSLVLMVFSFVLGVLATLNVPSHPRLNLGWACLTFLVAAFLFGSIHV
jgi:hypothetical protein